MNSSLLRLLSGSAGLFAALVAIAGPLLFIANERQEAKSSDLPPFSFACEYDNFHP